MVTRFTALKNRFIFRLRKLIGGELPLETETCRFVLISLLDLFMTFLLLYFSNLHLEVFDLDVLLVEILLGESARRLRRRDFVVSRLNGL